MRPANDNAPVVTPGADGLRIWINNRVVATGLSCLQAMTLLRAFAERQAVAS